MGLWGVIFTILAGAAPLYAMLFNVPLTVQGSGYAGPAAFLLATVAYFAAIVLATALGGRWVGLAVFIVLSAAVLGWWLHARRTEGSAFSLS